MLPSLTSRTGLPPPLYGIFLCLGYRLQDMLESCVELIKYSFVDEGRNWAWIICSCLQQFGSIDLEPSHNFAVLLNAEIKKMFKIGLFILRQSYYITPASLEAAMQTGMVLNSQRSTCLLLPGMRIKSTTTPGSGFLFKVKQYSQVM